MTLEVSKSVGLPSWSVSPRADLSLTVSGRAASEWRWLAANYERACQYPDRPRVTLTLDEWSQMERDIGGNP